MSTISSRRDATPIFSAVANDYYKKGISVIPLVYHEKRPVPNDWSRFHDKLPEPEEFAAWMRDYSNGNIGMVLGKQSGVTVIDIDLDTTQESNQRIMAIIESALPKSPWHRIGKKGKVMAFKFNDVPTFRIKDAGGNMLVEHLGARTQVVLPPSIHPSTKQPYQANAQLIDVIDQLPLLPKNIEEILRNILVENGFNLSLSGRTIVTDFVASGARDSKMIQVAGAYANGVMRGERPLSEAITLMRGWYEGFTEKVAGDQIDIDKGIQRMVEFVIRDVKERKKPLPRGWDEGLTEEDKRLMHLDFSEDEVEWDFDQIKEFVQEGFETHEPGSVKRSEIINRAIEKIAQNKQLNSIDQERLFKYIVDTSKEKLTVTVLKKRMNEIGQGDLMGDNHTEIAQAVIKDFVQYGELRVYGDKIWTYQGSHWVEKPERELRKWIAEEYGGLRMAKKESDHRQILSIVKTLLPEGIQSIAQKGVNFANGFLATDGKLYDHNPAYGATYTLPFRFLPEKAGKAPKFFEFLHQAWGNDADYSEKVSALQEAMCVTLFGMGPRFQRAILLEGAAKTGKSQLLKIVSSIVPDEARCVCPPDTWGDKFSPVTMHNKILNIAGELPEEVRINGQRFKDIISGDEIQLQYKNGQLFQAAIYATHWFGSNHLPKSQDTSEGFNRRWLILRFDNVIKAEQRILDYGEIIAGEEREGIVAWAVEALPRLLKNNEYTLPMSHAGRVGEMANLNNSVRFFLTEGHAVRFKKGSQITEMALHQKYYGFCVGPGNMQPYGMRQFRTKMRDLSHEFGFEIKMELHPSGQMQCIYDGIEVLNGAKK